MSSIHNIYTIGWKLNFVYGRSKSYEQKEILLYNSYIDVDRGWQKFYYGTGIYNKILQIAWQFRADSRFALSQWETALLCNDVSHCLGASLESALQLHI